VTGIDIVTRDLAETPNGTAFAIHAYVMWGDDYPISGDEQALIRAGVERDD
jgi:hypothetical protein